MFKYTSAGEAFCRIFNYQLTRSSVGCDRLPVHLEGLDWVGDESEVSGESKLVMYFNRRARAAAARGARAAARRRTRAPAAPAALQLPVHSERITAASMTYWRAKVSSGARACRAVAARRSWRWARASATAARSRAPTAVKQQHGHEALGCGSPARRTRAGPRALSSASGAPPVAPASTQSKLRRRLCNAGARACQAVAARRSWHRARATASRAPTAVTAAGSARGRAQRRGLVPARARPRAQQMRAR
jgi:hypothetical protein